MDITREREVENWPPRAELARCQCRVFVEHLVDGLAIQQGTFQTELPVCEIGRVLQELLDAPVLTVEQCHLE